MDEYTVKNHTTGKCYRILAGSAKKAKKTACHLDRQTEDKYVDYKVIEAKKLTKKGALRQQNSNHAITEVITLLTKFNITHTVLKSKGVV